MKKGEPLPAPLCFVPKELTLEFEGEEALQVFEEPKDGAKVVARLPQKKAHKLTCTGLPVFNSQGGWIRMTSPHSGWVLLQPAKKAIKGKLKIGKREMGENGGGGGKGPISWVKAVELMCSLQIIKTPLLSNHNSEEMLKLQTPPPGWNLEADEELAQFLFENQVSKLGGGGVVGGAHGSNHFVKIEVSSEESEQDNMLDPDLESFWESDGSQGQHWVRFFMKPGTVVEKFALLVDSDDGSYLPRRIIVKVGSTLQNLTTLHTRNFSSSDYQTKELQLFPYPLQEHKDIIEVHFKSCYQGGIDVRIHGISLTTRTTELVFMQSEVISEDSFSEDKVSRYPKLQGFNAKQLFYRALVLNRLAYLLDQDLTYVLPSWKHEGGSVILDSVMAVRQLWPLSQRRNTIIEDLLSSTSTSSPSRPTVYIDRMAAHRHRSDPTQDKEGKKSVFRQLIRELKKHTNSSSFNFRWAGQWAQWWECKFIQEGIIDQGGGFRDTLADIAEELCPSDPNSPIALPLFIRSPNQSQDSSNAYRDNYVPDPGCSESVLYQFVGQLMGAMFRSQESLVLSLPQFLWKQLVGEPVTWSRDFVSVDSAEVKLIDSIETMSEERFNNAFAGALNFTTVLSNGETISLVPDGSERLVTFEERLEYCCLVKEKRMSESNVQIKALHSGICKVIPASILGLLTWQELEVKVCGSPEISIEKLRDSTRYEGGLKAASPRVEMMWEALKIFTNEERSRLLRFITGRRRLPCTIYIDSMDGGSKLPTSATCSNTLYLPRYANVQEAVDRLRYAAYNCVAIDTDMTPWE